MEGQSGLSKLSVISWVSTLEGYPLSGVPLYSPLDTTGIYFSQNFLLSTIHTYGVGCRHETWGGCLHKTWGGCLHKTYVVYELCSPDYSTLVNSHQVIYDRKFWQAFLGGSRD